MGKAAVYARVSTMAQATKSSLATQLQKCLADAEKYGYEVPEERILQEQYTGATGKRPKFALLLEWVERKEISCVIVATGDRLSREQLGGPYFEYLLITNGIDLILDGSKIDFGAESILIRQVQGYVSSQEHKKIRQRTLGGLKERAKSGKLPGGRSVYLYGYFYSGGISGNGKRTFNETQAKLVREIFRMAASGTRIHAIAKYVTDMGISAPNGKRQWNPSTIHKMLTNPAYSGKPKAYHDIDLNGTTPPLITEELFREVQSKLKSNKALASRNTKVQYELRGHVYCGDCHRKYYASKMHKVRYYYCSGKLWILNPFNKCGNKTFQADYLEDRVWAVVTDVLTRPETIIAEIERQNNDNNTDELAGDIASIEKRLKELDSQQDQLLQWAFKGFPEQQVETENTKINTYRDNLKARLSEVQQRIVECRQTELNIEDIKHFCSLASANIENFGYNEKQLALEALRVEVWIKGDSITVKGLIPTTELSEKAKDLMDSYGDIVTTQLKRGGHNISFPFSIPLQMRS